MRPPKLRNARTGQLSTPTANYRCQNNYTHPKPKMWAPFLLLLLPALTLGDFQVDLLITREVRGAVWPLNKWNSPCSTDDVNATPCDCYGGASRRQAVFSSATEHVSIDTGSYFSGSGCAAPLSQIRQRPATFAPCCAPTRGQAVLPCLPRQRQRRVLCRGRVQSVDTLIPRLCRRRLGC